MPTTYQTADSEVTDMLDRVMLAHHPRLRDAGVRVGALMALNPEGDAIKAGGYAAFATIKPVSLKDRVSKSYDAELLIDEVAWRAFSDAQRAALLDHELSHIDRVEFSTKQLKLAQEDDPNAPTWKLDDLGRPRLRSVPGDWNAGDGFSEVVARHGLMAIEYANISRAKTLADAARSDAAQARSKDVA